MADAILLYVTSPNHETGAALAEKLISDRMAACVNLLPGMTSVYDWQGKVEQATEVVMIVKTTTEKAAPARDMILTEHPYECPCIVALPISGAHSHQPFLDWIGQNTS